MHTAARAIRSHSVLGSRRPAVPELWAMAPFGLALFLSGLLLFQVELIIGKYILPWFGGSPAAWITGMLVFQLLLLAGYGYAHLIATRVKWKTQVLAHLCIVAGSIMLLVLCGVVWPSPITPPSTWKPDGAAHPEFQALAIMLASAGVPFFVLSATAPLLQHWAGRFGGKCNPYRLYAFSNLGSLLALCSYPVLIEPYFRLHVQAWAWTMGYLLFALGVCACAASVSGRGVMAASESVESHEPLADRAMARLYPHWLALAACASTALFAVTNVMCQDVASVALLWVVPLSVYLITFVICFGTPRWYIRGVFHSLLAAATILAFCARCTHSIPFQLPAYTLALFAIGMVCHGELARLKPSDAGLTRFYTAVAAGGAMGGIFVAVVAPRLFAGFWEFELSLWGANALLVLTAYRDRSSWWHSRKPWLGIVLLGAAFLIPWAANRVNPIIGAMMQELSYYRALVLVAFPALSILAILTLRDRRQSAARVTQVYAIAMLALYAYAFGAFIRWRSAGSVARVRNFHGVFLVQRDRFMTFLIHGATYHGAQYRGPANSLRPTLYYGPGSGIGTFLNSRGANSATPMRMGVIGLGAGTLAAYGRPGDYIRFYESDPDILRLSQGPHPLFTYLKDSPARLDVVLGDARLSLKREAANGNLQRFDVLVADAFSGDAIPVHLLTREAVETYLKHLEGPDGVLAFHITNASLDLRPLIISLGREFHLAAVPLVGYDRDTQGTNEWVLLSRNRHLLETPELLRLQPSPEPDLNTPVWTDDYSNVWQLIVAKLRERH